MKGLLLEREFFAGDARDVARALIGKLLVRSDGRVARLVEVEAYMGLDDPASHAFRGPTPRTRIMFGPPGFLYVYFSYGVHWCANVVCGPDGTASAVLLRAAQPVEGIAVMRAARWHGQRELRERDLCRGPGRLCEAFGVTGADNGADLTSPNSFLRLADDGAGSGGKVVATLRVGLSRGVSSPWRYILDGSRWVSAGPRPVGPEPAGPFAGGLEPAGREPVGPEVPGPPPGGPEPAGVGAGGMGAARAGAGGVRPGRARARGPGAGGVKAGQLGSSDRTGPAEGRSRQGETR